MASRAHRTPFGEWWWTVDKLTLAAVGALMLAGVVLSLAASPPVAARLGLDRSISSTGTLSISCRPSR